MQAPTYRVQFVDDRGETAFTQCSSSRSAIDQACRMQKHSIVQGIVDDLTGDIYMTAAQIRDEARLRSRRGEHGRHLILSRERGG
jgi:hypothetical protein